MLAVTLENLSTSAPVVRSTVSTIYRTVEMIASAPNISYQKKNSFQNTLIRSYQLAFSLRNIALREGSLPPSRRRSLFTLATSMIVFSSKAFDILPLVSIAKSSLQETLSESSAMRAQLLKDFLPDDLCPLGGQFVQVPVPGQITAHGKDHKSEKEVNSSVFLEEDMLTEASDSVIDKKSQLHMNCSLLSVDQLLESVLEKARRVGRISVSSTPDLPFKEMANHCEALLMGKQQKLSVFVASQQKQEVSQDQYNTSLAVSSYPNQLQTNGNPFLEQNPITCPKPISTRIALTFATEYQNRTQFMRLPASSPFDNFLKSAGF